jgi:hypothetical protein
VIVPMLLLVAVLGLAGCKGTLEQGGAYAPIGTNGVVTIAPDYAFYVVDSGFDLAYSTVDGAFKFEADNRMLLWSISPNIKHTLDQLRPQAVTIRNEYAAARAAYMANPTPAGLTTLQAALAKAQQIAAAAMAVLPNQAAPAGN